MLHTASAGIRGKTYHDEDERLGWGGCAAIMRRSTKPHDKQRHAMHPPEMTFHCWADNDDLYIKVRFAPSERFMMHASPGESMVVLAPCSVAYGKEPVSVP